MTTCTTPICADACGDELPQVEFNICAPATNYGQVSKMYITNDGYPLTDENDLAEWQTRANLPSDDASRILELTVIGDKPLPTVTEVAISKGRTTTGVADHILNLEIDETNQTNYEFMRQTECGSFTKRIWFETYGGLLYGGATGILATIKLGEEIPTGTADLIKIKGTAKWKSKFSPCRTTSPMAGIDLVGAPSAPCGIGCMVIGSTFIIG